MKKILTGVLIVTVLGILCTSCTKKETKPTVTEKIKLEFWTWLGSDEAIAAYNASQDNVEIVKVQMSHADINAKLAIALQAGTGAPDIYQTTQRYFTQFKDSEKMYDMSADVSGVITGFAPSLQALVSKDGKVFGLPPDISPSVMWYRKDIFTENGITAKTFSELEAGAKKLKVKGIFMLPIFNPAGSWGANAVGMLLGSRGGNYFTSDGQVVKNNKDLEIVLAWLNNMIKNGYGESLTFFTPEFWGEFKSGKIAAWIMNTAEGANIKKNAPELSGKWGVMPTPRWDDKDKALSGFWGGTVLSVPNQTKHPKEAAAFVKWLAGTVEGQVWAGKTWSAVPALTKAFDDPFFSAGDAYFSNDCVYKIINETSAFYYFDWAIVEKIIGEKLDLMFAGKADPVATARSIEDAIAKETGR